MNAKTIRYILGGLCILGLIIGLFLPIIGATDGVHSYGLTAANVIFGGDLVVQAIGESGLRTFLSIFYILTLVFLLVCAVFAFIPAMSDKAVSRWGKFAGIFSLVLSLLALILFAIACGEVGGASIGAGSILLPIICIAIIVFAVMLGRSWKAEQEN